MGKIIVMHFNPDLDAITCAWLLKRFKEGWQEAEVKFCDAGGTLNGTVVDSDESVIHVDTGGGRFDHHLLESDRSCSAKLVLEYLGLKSEALKQLVEVVIEVDNGEMLYEWCDPGSIRYEFCLPNILWGIKNLYPGEDEKALDFVLESLEIVYHTIKKKISAQTVLASKGKEFETGWGRAVALETTDGAVDWEGRLLGYVLVVRQNPQNGAISIRGRKDRGVDLSNVYKKIQIIDKEGDWFLHASKVLLLNSSGKNRSMKPTKLNLDEVVEIIKAQNTKH